MIYWTFKSSDAPLRLPVAEGARRTRVLDHSAALNRFLAQVERRAFGMARMASGSPDDALDIVQDTMLHFARLYANRPEGEWNVLFYKDPAEPDHRLVSTDGRAETVPRLVRQDPGDDEDDEEDPMARVPIRRRRTRPRGS